jgi:hypothetical protein
MEELADRNIDDLLSEMQLPEDAKHQMKSSWKELERLKQELPEEVAPKLDRDADLITGDMKVTEMAAGPEGGVTKWVARWWGWELYLDHKTTQALLTGAELASIVTAPVFIISAALQIGKFIYKAADKGNGIIYMSLWVAIPPGAALWVRSQ